jgi:hypothetical protein
MSGFDERADGHRARYDNAPNELDLTDETVPPGEPPTPITVPYDPAREKENVRGRDRSARL